ncbi:MAG: amidase [Anaerolineae bacterium]|nr:amidase [Anaerolineae bacterium]
MSNELCWLTARELARRIRAREVSCVEVMQAHLAQIECLNPQVNAIVTLDADGALKKAADADRALASGNVCGPLHGLPIAHKDLQETRGMRTTYGSPIYRDFIPDVNSLLVDRLQSAGALSIGKTNVPEFGAGSQTFNPVFGATRNPYDLTKTCGGSSGGAAVALACGMMPIADGSDMGGSLRNPANFCNVVGFRPSPGRVPDYPAKFGWQTLSVDGPMARTVGDAALVLSAMAGPDERSPIALQDPGELFARPLERDFKGARIAWASDCWGLPFEPEVRRIVDAQSRVFETLGCVVEQVEPDLSDADEIFKALRAWSFEASRSEDYQNHRSQLKDTVLWNIEAGQTLTGPQLGRIEQKRTALYQRVREFMQAYEFLILPVSQVLPFDVNTPYPTEINGVPMTTYIDWMKSCYYISVTGLPAISVPCGFSQTGLPVGIQIVGRYRDDWGVLQLGNAYESETECWKKQPLFTSRVSCV